MGTLMTDIKLFLRAAVRAAVVLGLATSSGLAQTAATDGAAGQDTTAQPAPAADAAPAEDGASDLSMGQEVAPEDGPGTSYVAGTFGEWENRCVRAPEGQTDRCELYQLLQDQSGNSVAEISMFGLPAGQPAAAGATIVTPLLTLLTQQITMKIDDGTAKRYPFTWCSQIGCYARIGFTADEIAAFKRGKKATVTIVPVAAPDTTVDLDVSLIGFTAGYEAVNKANGS
jgi:invasion protein IalB